MQRPDYTLAQLLVAQEELEQEATAAGEELFLARVNKAAERGTFADAEPVRKLFNEGLLNMDKALNTWLGHVKAQRGTRHTAIKWVEAIGTRESAYLALRVVLDGLLETRSEQDVARRISQLLIDELRFRRLKKDRPHAFEYKMREFAERGTTHYKHRANVLLRTAKLEGVELGDIDMSPTERIHVGYKMLDIVQHVVGLVESVRPYQRVGRKIESERLLLPDQQVKEWLNRRTALMAAMSPLALPMVVQPIDWSGEQQGGYRFGLRGRFHLVRKNVGTSKAEQGEVSPVYDALNAAQGTPWRINSRVMDVARSLRGNAVDLPGYEDTELPLPARPLDINENEEARKVWRRAASDKHRENRTRAQNAKSLDTIFTVVDRVEQYSAIYFPHSLDFRGRVYPVPAYLHPQGPDLCRSLLEFAEAVPVGEHGRRWLAIHLANTYGETPGGQKVSKMPLDERVRWVEDNTPQIVAVANDPEGNRWWASAEEPWQCLAACIEWAGVTREGITFASRLPVAIDGSCNGLQHLSAALKDERSGAAVNLVPSSLPKDVYTDVAQEAARLLSELLTLPDNAVLDPTAARLRTLALDMDMGSRWLASGLIGRKAAKRPTMTVAYGSRTFGFKAQIAEWMQKDVDPALIREHFTFTDEDGKEKKLYGKASQLLAELFMEAMSGAIAGPMRAMDWMQDCADIVTQSGKPVEWTVPVTGWRVKQAYYGINVRRVKTMLAGETVMPNVAEVTDTLDSRRQRNGIAPNVVHSLDAACLVLAVQMARVEGVEAFGLIHDSYACHAAHMPILARAARQAFVRLYTTPVLADLRAQFQQQTDDELPPVPEQGALDVGGVLASDFFFA